MSFAFRDPTDNIFSAVCWFIYLFLITCYVWPTFLPIMSSH